MRISKIESTFLLKIISYTVSFIISLIFIKAEITGLGPKFFLYGSSSIKRVLYASYEDVAFSLIFSLFFIVLVLIINRSVKAKMIVYRSFLCLLFVFLMWSLFNIKAVQVLNVPVNYQLLYYSNLLDSDFIVDSVIENLSWGMAFVVISFAMAVFGLGFLFYRIISNVNFTLRLSVAIICTLCIAALGYFVAAHQYMDSLKQNYYDEYVKMSNPVMTFTSSLASEYNNDSRFFDELPAEVFRKIKEENQKRNHIRTVEMQPNHQVRNVVLFVMESVGAEYVFGNAKDYSVTPVLNDHFNNSLQFNNIYAHSPNSTNAMFSLLSSTYPLLSFKNVVKEYPDVNIPTLSSELKNQNYKTAFFGFGDKTYMGVNEFLRHRAFDKIVDHQDVTCSNGMSFSSDAEGAEHGKDEMCIVDAFSTWVSEEIKEEPFFATLWTMQTHWPYFVSGTEKDYGVENRDLNKYLNALNHSDAMLGRLLEDLKKKGLYESTLVVVVGDHGEAFGSHGQFGHGSNIYEENVHIPLVLINPILFKGEKRGEVGGHVDIPATILDLLGYAQPVQWQGRSLLDADRDNTTFFFSTWSDYLFGLRTSEYKIIYNAYTGKSRVFDLSQDPFETQDLSYKIPAVATAGYDQLSSWTLYNRALMNEIVSSSIHVE